VDQVGSDNLFSGENSIDFSFAKDSRVSLD
jgi:hypothetical protein